RPAQASQNQKTTLAQNPERTSLRRWGRPNPARRPGRRNRPRQILHPGEQGANRGAAGDTGVAGAGAGVGGWEVCGGVITESSICNAPCHSSRAKRGSEKRPRIKRDVIYSAASA